MSSLGRAVALASACLAGLAIALPGAAQVGLRPGEVPLSDLLEILVVDRQLLAVDAQGGGQTTERLELDEQVLWKGSRGILGVVLTDRRILAAGASSGSWQQTRVRRTERLPAEALLGERVAMVITSERVIGFVGSGGLVDAALGIQENVVATRTGQNVALLVTDRRVLGLSPFAGGFVASDLGLRERIVEVEAGANLGTLRTDRRLLIFRAPTGSWEERRLELQ